MTFKLQKLSNDLGYKKSTIKSSTSFNQILVQSFDKKIKIHLSKINSFANHKKCAIHSKIRNFLGNIRFQENYIPWSNWSNCLVQFL